MQDSDISGLVLDNGGARVITALTGGPVNDEIASHLLRRVKVAKACKTTVARRTELGIRHAQRQDKLQAAGNLDLT